MLDLQHLKTFMVVATTKNFSRAATELGYSQPSVTQHIKALERELGARLFNRFRFARTIVLTDVGRRIYRIRYPAPGARGGDQGSRPTQSQAHRT